MRHRQIVKMLIAVLGLFVVCRGPHYVSDMALDSRKPDSTEASATMTIRQMASFVLTCNSLSMPVVYSLFNRKMRQYVVDVIASSRRCSRRSKALNTKPPQRAFKSVDLQVALATTGMATTGSSGHDRSASRPRHN